MPIYIKKDGIWKTSSTNYVKVNGTWKQLKAAWVKQSNSWKKLGDSCDCDARTCTCQSRTTCDGENTIYCDCKSREYAALICYCNIRTRDCICQVRVQDKHICYCDTRTTSYNCICNTRSTCDSNLICPCVTRTF